MKFTWPLEIRPEKEGLFAARPSVVTLKKQVETIVPGIHTCGSSDPADEGRARRRWPITAGKGGVGWTARVPS